jgi:hypothetical protein
MYWEKRSRQRCSTIRARSEGWIGTDNHVQDGLCKRVTASVCKHPPPDRSDLCSVKGAYCAEEKTTRGDQEAEDAFPRAMVSGYARNHRADLKQGTPGLVMIQRHPSPLVVHSLDGKRSDNKRISPAVSSEREPEA